MKKSEQFIPILKKDLKLVFTWKTMMVIVFVPFIMMFLIIGVPTLFIGTASTTVYICSDDLGANVTNYDNLTFSLNLGDKAIAYVQEYANNVSNLDVEIVDTRLDALNESNGIYIPANYTSEIFAGTTAIEYHSTSGSASFQGVYFNEVKLRIQELVLSWFLALNLDVAFPDYNEVAYIPPVGEPTSGWSAETLVLASPFAYALFIMVALIGNMGRTIGFSKEKEDGTFETMLTITKNRSLLVLSKLLVGVIATNLSILAYFVGSALAGAMAKSLSGGTDNAAGLEGILAFPMSDLLSFKGVILLIGLGSTLVLAMLTLMTFDTMFSKTVSERIGTSVVMGFGMLFYFTVAFDPGTTAIYARINPFYWIYHAFLSMIDLSFAWLDALYIVLFLGLFALLLLLARRAIEREKALFT